MFISVKGLLSINNNYYLIFLYDNFFNVNRLFSLMRYSEKVVKNDKRAMVL